MNESQKGKDEEQSVTTGKVKSLDRSTFFNGKGKSSKRNKNSTSFKRHRTQRIQKGTKSGYQRTRPSWNVFNFNMCIFFVLFSYLSTFLGKSNVNANATFDLNDIFSTGKHKTSYGRKQEYQEDYNFAGW